MSLVKRKQVTEEEAAEILLRRRAARKNFAEFCAELHPDEPPALHHRILCEALDEVAEGTNDRLMVFMPPGSAKALALDTYIPTPDGWSTIGEIKVGDKVLDENGLPCNVTWKSEIFRDRPCYKVLTDCGDEIIADRDHEWLVRLCGKRDVFKIKETHELCRQRSKRPMVKRAKAFVLPDLELPLDPYILGVWLGDGDSSNGAVTASEDDGSWLRAEFSRLGYETSTRSVSTKFGVLDIRKHLVSLGLLTDHLVTGDKHIPLLYLRASESQRLALLQGLIDSDGTVCKERGCATFCNTNKRLAEDVRHLVRTLGRKAGWSESIASLYGKDCGKAYKVSFYHKEAARLPRKHKLCRDQYRTPNTYIEVTKTENTDTVCIEVDSPSHLFLCGESMTPTHNSTYGSKNFPAYYLGRYPDRSIICGSYGEGLSTMFGKAVRNIVNSREYHLLFDTRLSEDSRAKGEWETNKGGSYYAVGVGSGVTGRRSDLNLIDDPVKGRKDADSQLVRDECWNWYLSDFTSRLKLGQATSQVIIQCMTGDTSVTMGDGSLKYLRDIKIGDEVATYDDGEITTSKVLNWKNQGSDSILKMRMSSGIIVRANKRHPFLIERKGKLEWTRLGNVAKGQNILRVTGGNGKESSVQLMGAKNPQNAEGCATPTMGRQAGHLGTDQKAMLTQLKRETGILSIATELLSKITTICLKSRMVSALFATNPPVEMCAPTGAGSYALTTATTQTKSERYYVTTATLPSGTRKTKKPLPQLLNTSDFTLDEVVEITEDGFEDVFDIQVERTENFIANGLVSHNTRWHPDDLSGRILPPDWNFQSGVFEGFDGKAWTVICLPAQAEDNDILGREKGDWLWPEAVTPEQWESIKSIQTAKDMRNWSALYQQRPQPDSGVFFKREWFEPYRYKIGEAPLTSDYGATDYAVTKGSGDFTEHGIAGFDENKHIWFKDWWSGQETLDVSIEEQVRLAKKYEPYSWLSEVGVIRRSVEPFLVKRQRDSNGLIFRMEWMNHIGDKGAHARSFQAMASQGMVHIPYCEWGDQLLDQLVRFIPNTNFKDDKVDVCGLFGRKVDTAFTPSVTAEETRPVRDAYGFDEEPTQFWKTL